MTQPVLLRENFYGITILGEECGAIIKVEDGKSFINVGNVTTGEYWQVITLPQGSWQIICTTKEITEERAIGINPPLNNPFLKINKYRNHLVPQTETVADATRDWKESFDSLLRSVNLNPDNNYLILKKQ